MKLDKEASKKAGVPVMRSVKPAAQKESVKEEKRASKKMREEVEHDEKPDFMREE